MDRYGARGRRPRNYKFRKKGSCKGPITAVFAVYALRVRVHAREGTRILIDHLRLHGASRRFTSSSRRAMIHRAAARTNSYIYLYIYIYTYIRRAGMGIAERKDAQILRILHVI